MAEGEGQGGERRWAGEVVEGGEVGVRLGRSQYISNLEIGNVRKTKDDEE